MSFLSKLQNNKYITLVLIGCILLNVGLYVFQINNLTKNIYLTKEYREKAEELTKTNSKLATKSFKDDSWTTLEKQIEKYNFEKVDNSKYVKVTGNSVVKAE